MNVYTNDDDRVYTSRTIPEIGDDWNYKWMAPRGWVCPKCGRVYSPNTPMCFYCSNNEQPTVTTTTTNPTNLGSDTFRVHLEDQPYYEVGGSDYWDESRKAWINQITNILKRGDLI